MTIITSRASNIRYLKNLIQLALLLTTRVTLLRSSQRNNKVLPTQAASFEQHCSIRMPNVYYYLPFVSAPLTASDDATIISVFPSFFLYLFLFSLLLCLDLCLVGVSGIENKGRTMQFFSLKLLHRGVNFASFLLTRCHFFKVEDSVQELVRIFLYHLRRMEQRLA